MFVRDKRLQPILKMEPARVKKPSGAQLLGRLLAETQTLGCDWKGLPVTNTLAYLSYF
jgi:hypothetical protein